MGLRCIAFVGHDREQVERALCRAGVAPVATPAWLADVKRAFEASGGETWKIDPIPAPASRVALRLQVGVESYYVLVHHDGRWHATSDAVAYSDGRLVGPMRVIDTTALTGRPSFGVIADSYAGGSEQGESTRELVVVCPDGASLASCGSKVLGKLVWNLPGKERSRYPGGAARRDARPSIEVQLEPTIDPLGTLRLKLAIDRIPAKFRARFDYEDCSADDEILTAGPSCAPLRAVEALRKEAGTWRLVNGAFVPADEAR